MDVLGETAAVEVFLALGGSIINLAYNPRSSDLMKLVGSDKAAALARRLGIGNIKVPIPKPFIAQVLYFNGATLQDIARQLHVDLATVARQLKATPGGRRRSPDARQIELF